MLNDERMASASPEEVRLHNGASGSRDVIAAYCMLPRESNSQREIWCAIALRGGQGGLYGRAEPK